MPCMKYLDFALFSEELTRYPPSEEPTFTPEPTEEESEEPTETTEPSANPTSFTSFSGSYTDSFASGCDGTPTLCKFFVQTNVIVSHVCEVLCSDSNNNSRFFCFYCMANDLQY